MPDPTDHQEVPADAQLVANYVSDRIRAKPENLEGPVKAFRIAEGERSQLVVVATSGVAGKLDVAIRSGDLSGIGYDLVAATVDEVSSVGARPLALSVHLALNDECKDEADAIFASLGDAAKVANCGLTGAGSAAATIDRAAPTLVGSAVGVVAEEAIVTGAGIGLGDVVIGLESDVIGLAGFDRLAAADLDLTTPLGSATVAEMLLAPSPVYSAALLSAIEIGAVHALARVGDGGIGGSLGRTLGPSVAAHLDRSAWHVPDVFDDIKDLIALDDAEMWAEFGMGLGIVGVVNAEYAEAIRAVLDEYERSARIIGEIVPGSGEVSIS